MARMTAKEFAKKEKEILSAIPQEFHGAVSYQAYEDGHAYGYEEVLIHVQNLVGMLEKPIADFKKRLCYLYDGCELRKGVKHV
jgi:hypothetical protein